MNKEDFVKRYLDFLFLFDLQPEEFVISAGGACLMFGLRNETNDMDADISDELFDQFKSEGTCLLSMYGNTEILKYDDRIDLHRKPRDIETIIVDGVCCYSPKEVLVQKKRMNRPKDQADIEKLEKLISFLNETQGKTYDHN